MKRKVLGLTMEVKKEYDNRHHLLYTSYTFISLPVLSVVNGIISELSTQYSMVENKTESKEVETDYGIIEVYTGSIICRNKEQMLEYFAEIGKEVPCSIV